MTQCVNYYVPDILYHISFVVDRIPELKRRRSVFENGEKLIVAIIYFSSFVFITINMIMYIVMYVN